MHNYLLCQKKRLPLVGKWEIMFNYFNLHYGRYYY